MKYDFLSEMALDSNDEESIDRSIQTEALKPAPWSVKAAVLSTGLGQDDDFDSQIKNGQKENHNRGEIWIGGYPRLFPQNCGFAQVWQEFFTLQDKDLQHCPDFSCFIEIDLELVRPFYSRDDRAFYPIENPVKRDWVFHEPYLAAAGIKGLLRWAWKTCWSGDKSKSDLAGKLFGLEKENLTEENAQIGMLYICPLFWKGRVELESINPHDSESGAGLKPIKYEVVQRGGKGKLALLIVNREESLDSLRSIMAPFWEALMFLLENSGLSAKRSADWGQVEVSVNKCKAFLSGLEPPEESKEEADFEGLSSEWDAVTDEAGDLCDLNDQTIFTKKRVHALLPDWSMGSIKRDKSKALEEIQRLWDEMQSGGQNKDEKQDLEKVDKKSLIRFESENIRDLGKKIQNTLQHEGEV